MKLFPNVAILIAFGLTLAALPIAVADEDDDEDPRDSGRPTMTPPSDRKGPSDAEDDEDDEDDASHGKGKEGARSDDGERGPRKPGRIVVSNGSYDGRYVDFSFDEDACVLSDYRVYNQSFFSQIALQAPCEVRAHGAEIDIRSNETRLRIHDAPNGLLRIEGEDDQTVHIALAPGLVSNATKKGVELRVGNLSGLLRIDADEDDNETTVDFVNATSGDIRGDARFWVHPLKGDSPERKEIRDAVKKGKVAGEIDVIADNGSTSTQVLAYEDVIIKTGKKDNSTYRFLVDANLTEGRTFVVNLGPGVFKHDRIAVRYYDIDNTSVETEVAITKADDLQDILSIEDGEGPEYWITKDEGGTHVLVSVPHFSVHAFEVMSLQPTVAPLILGGVLAALVVVAVAAVGVLRPRRA